MSAAGGDPPSHDAFGATAHTQHAHAHHPHTPAHTYGSPASYATQRPLLPPPGTPPFRPPFLAAPYGPAYGRPPFLTPPMAPPAHYPMPAPLHTPAGPPPPISHATTVPANTPSSVASSREVKARGTVLLVRHLPADMPDDDKAVFFRHFGAESVECMTARGPLRNSAFVKFASEDAAAVALGRLHQLLVGGKPITAEYAREGHTRQLPTEPHADVEGGREGVAHKEKEGEVDAGSSSTATAGATESEARGDAAALPAPKAAPEPVAQGLGFHFPSHPALEYAYPPPTEETVLNMAHALVAVPRLYVQVLHLMNKMNLPPPFGALTPAPPLPGSAAAPPLPPDARDSLLSSGESEYESDDNEKDFRQAKRRRITREPSPPPAPKHLSALDEMLAKALRPKLGASAAVDAARSAHHVTPFAPAQADDDTAVPMDAVDHAPSATAEGSRPPQAVSEPQTRTHAAPRSNAVGVPTDALDPTAVVAGRANPDELASHAAFRSYAEGEPSNRLYVKNLAKGVAVVDIARVFGSYAASAGSDVLDVQLFTEGRLKGQAFVTLPSVESAASALRDAHGYVLQGRPMSVQFARGGKGE